jgi:hypothetical protein
MHPPSPARAHRPHRGRVESNHPYASDDLVQSRGEQPLPALRVKVALCGYLGQVDEGNRWLGRLRELNRGLTAAGFDSFAATFLSPEVRVRYVEGMRKAGLPEE